MEKTKYITCRTPEDLNKSYKKMCRENGYTLSNRIRALMEADLNYLNDGRNILAKNNERKK